MNIDFVKMLKQDPQFKDYVDQIVAEVIIKANPDFIQALYSMYQSNIEVEKAIQFIVSNMKIFGSNK